MTAGAPGFPQYGGGVPRPPKRGIGTGWIIAIAAISVVVVAGVAGGAFALLNRGGDDETGKYRSAPLPTCDDVANRVGDLPPKSSDTKLGGSPGWLCTFTDSADALTVHLDLEVSTVQRVRTRFDVYTTSGGYLLDPTVRLGESAAWGPSPTGRECTLAGWDSNATFKVEISDWKLAANDTQTCKDRAKAIAQALYDAIQPR